jgi:hypothetical protein
MASLNGKIISLLSLVHKPKRMWLNKALLLGTAQPQTAAWSSLAKR